MKNLFTLKFVLLLFSFNLNAQIQLQWEIQPNLPVFSSGSRILSDHANNVYVSGIDSFFHQQTNYYKHLVIIKTDHNGNILWQMPFTTFSSDNMVKDDSDDFYIDAGGITKIDVSGNVLWQNNSIIPYDSSYHSPVRGQLVLIDSQRNLYTLGYIPKFPSGDIDICLAKFDSQGNFLWNAIWDSFAGNDYCTDLKVDKNGNVYVSGEAGYASSIGNATAVLIKYDSSGNKIWQFEYNGTQSKNDAFYGIAIDSSQNIFLAGVENVDISYSNALLIKLDSLRNIIWKNNYSTVSNNHEQTPTVKLDSLNNILFSGITDKIFLSKYSESGALLWSTTYQPQHPGINNPALRDIETDHQENIIITGEQNDTIFTAIFDSSGNKTCDFFYQCGGGSGPKSVCIDQSNNVLVTGEIQGPLMILLKYGLGTTGINPIQPNASFQIYPNPSRDKFYIKSDGRTIDRINIYNSLGSLVKRVNSANEFDLVDFSSGFYFCNIKSNDGASFNAKIIKE